MIWIATFYSHFGAMRYQKSCEAAGVRARLMPVPRDLSSSCGTCVRCEGKLVLPEGESLNETEQLVECLEKGYRPIWQADN